MTKKLQPHLRPQREGSQRPGEGRDLVLCVQSGPHVPRRGSPVYHPTSAWLSGEWRQSHGQVLASMWVLLWWYWYYCSSSTGSSTLPLYIATYRESANRRVSLAETLRRLPLSFFGKP